MPAISLQFHAMPTENYSFAKASASKFNLLLNAELFPQSQLLRLDDRAPAIEDLPQDRMLAIYFMRRDSYLADEFPVPLELPGYLRLRVGAAENQKLHESALGCRIFDPDDHSVWKRIVREFKKIAPTGGVYWGLPGTASFRIKAGHRVTKGARQYALDGNTLVDISGLPFWIEA